jgi:hypothetical protein
MFGTHGEAALSRRAKGTAMSTSPGSGRSFGKRLSRQVNRDRPLGTVVLDHARELFLSKLARR